MQCAVCSVQCAVCIVQITNVYKCICYEKVIFDSTCLLEMIILVCYSSKSDVMPKSLDLKRFIFKLVNFLNDGGLYCAVSPGFPTVSPSKSLLMRTM